MHVQAYDPATRRATMHHEGRTMGADVAAWSYAPNPDGSPGDQFLVTAPMYSDGDNVRHQAAFPLAGTAEAQAAHAYYLHATRRCPTLAAARQQVAQAVLGQGSPARLPFDLSARVGVVGAGPPA